MECEFLKSYSSNTNYNCLDISNHNAVMLKCIAISVFSLK